MAYLRWRRGGVAGSGGTVAGGFPSLSLSSVFVLFSADSLSSFLFRFSFCFSPLSTLCRAFLLLLSSLLFFFFLRSPSPVFIGKNRGGRHGGAATVGRPLHYRSVDKKDGVKWVKCGRLIAPKPGKKVGEKRRKKMILLPFSLRVLGKKTMVPFQNGTVLRFF